MIRHEGREGNEDREKGGDGCSEGGERHEGNEREARQRRKLTSYSSITEAFTVVFHKKGSQMQQTINIIIIILKETTA